MLLDQALIFGDEAAQIVRAEIGIEEIAAIFLGDFQRFLERAVVELEHHVGIHLDEAAVAVPREARVARGGREALDGLVVEPEVEDGVHHPRHRCACTRPDRDEQRVGRVAEHLAGDALDMRDPGRDFVAQALRELAALIVIDCAEIGRNREARRDRQADRRHLRQIRALAPQQIPVALAPIGHPAAEAVYVLSHASSL
ncbi:hypothetical protein ABIC16_003143 [Sphingomonas sp. PvP055]